MHKKYPLHILIVEDNPGDTRLIQEAFSHSEVNIQLHDVKDGLEALAFLRRQPPFLNVPKPHIILLDLNLPKKSGCEVLDEIKRDPHLKTIPVIVLTTSKAPEDIQAAYMRHANCFIAKPVDLDQYLDIFLHIERFWFHVVELPK